MLSCRGNCEGWKHMVNFIRGLSKYAVADRCRVCEVWFPKYSLLKCPCCRGNLRGRPASFPKGGAAAHHIKKAEREEQCEQIRMAVKEGWQPLKEEIWKSVLDWRIIHNMELDGEK